MDKIYYIKNYEHDVYRHLVQSGVINDKADDS